MLCSQTCCTTARVLLTVRLTSQNCTSHRTPDEPELCRTRPVGTDALCLPRADFPILRPYVAPCACGVLPLSVRSPVLLLSPVSCSPSSSSRRGLRAKNTLRFALLRVDHLRAGLRAQGGGPATEHGAVADLNRRPQPRLQPHHLRRHGGGRARREEAFGHETATHLLRKPRRRRREGRRPRSCRTGGRGRRPRSRRHRRRRRRREMTRRPAARPPVLTGCCAVAEVKVAGDAAAEIEVGGRGRAAGEVEIDG